MIHFRPNAAMVSLGSPASRLAIDQDPLFYRVTLRSLVIRHLKLIFHLAWPICVLTLAFALATWLSPFSPTAKPVTFGWFELPTAYELFNLLILNLCLIGTHAVAWRALTAEPSPFLARFSTGRRRVKGWGREIALLLLAAPVLLMTPVWLAFRDSEERSRRFEGHAGKVWLFIFWLPTLGLGLSAVLSGWLSGLAQIGLVAVVVTCGMTLLHHDLRVASQEIVPAGVPADHQS